MVGQWQDLGSVNIWDASIISQRQPCPLAGSPRAGAEEPGPGCSPLGLAPSPTCLLGSGAQPGLYVKGRQVAAPALLLRLRPPIGASSPGLTPRAAGLSQGLNKQELRAPKGLKNEF